MPIALKSRPGNHRARDDQPPDPPPRESSGPVKIALVSDAWTPQVNGVVRTLGMVSRELGAAGHSIIPITPDRFRTFPCPTYPEIRLAIGAGRAVRRMIDESEPDAIHIATEGPLGHAARAHCIKRGLPFTTAYHTRFPEYVEARFAFPRAWSYALLRRFHAPSGGVLVATDSIRQDLASRGFHNLRRWSRGVDAELFRPYEDAERDFLGLKRPIFVTVARLAVEKNLSAFLELDLPGSKLVVGDGPLLNTLQRRHPEAHFAGKQVGEALARHYAAADVFVFPSRTDTFGLVLLEALACGVPVAAYPVPGPLDVIGDGGAGCLDEDLRKASLAALDISREACRRYALNFTWSACATQFLQSLCPIH
ncbi:MAG: glycosyltransferase family 1 protein [Alphaproteobacteria bacterium]|nr:glycosyltransferase family 1 protein [Alphaproteobacteria bacterium]